MKKILLVFGLFTTMLTVSAQENEGITLTVVIENVLNDQGYVLSALHSQETFMKTDGLETRKDKAEKGSLTLTFTHIQPGAYAVSVLHDENDNNIMDFETNGMPKENYAMSQNPMLMGPPSFKDVKFTVDRADLDLTLRF